MLIVLPATGTVPLSQFEPVIQSLLVAPVQFCAAADRGTNAESATNETPISSRRRNAAPLPVKDERWCGCLP
ncbi:hypothetical protein [Bradyrhizobium yuanmingense]|uniref:hypothetical protein n=1 Tax=Bradyrhizobium yuanmingense TaxID=108015 RepID=UPI00187D15C0|nr:hypothetical protein [Bradyrhizobium yuanmingense]